MTNRKTMRKPPQVRTPPASGFARGCEWVAAVDAAKHAPAVALGCTGVLTLVTFDLNPGAPGVKRISCPGVVVLELSRSYGARDTGRHQDILDETCGGALTAGALCGEQVVLVHPDEWAGQTEKPARHQLIWKQLKDPERELVAAASPAFNKITHATPFAIQAHIEAACDALALGKTPKYSHPVHNLLDAVGLYLFAVGRIRKGGAKPR